MDLEVFDSAGHHIEILCGTSNGKGRYSQSELNRISTSLHATAGRTHQKVVVVALANKLVRMAWAVLCKNERYRAPALTVTT